MRIRRVLSEAVIGLRRNLVMSIAAVVTVAISLAFVGGALLVRQNVDRLEVAFDAEIEVFVFLDKGVTDPERDEIARVLGSLDLVQRVTYVSKREAYERFLERNPNDRALTENVSPEALPESYNVRLKDPSMFEVVASALDGQPGVEQVDDNREVLRPLFSILNGLNLFALAIAVIQVVAATLLIANTVRLTAFSRRRETEVMRLVGATRLYIQLPFLLEGVVVGLVGTAFGTGLLVLGKATLIDKQLADLFTGVLVSPSYDDIAAQVPWLLAIGLGVSAVTSVLALQRYVRL